MSDTITLESEIERLHGVIEDHERTIRDLEREVDEWESFSQKLQSILDDIIYTAKEGLR